MAQYIDKSAIVAEIERRLVALANTSAGDNREFAAIIGAQHYELINLAQYINTLEVKEVDYEKELEKYWNPFITTQDLIEKYVSDHAANRWLDASELEQLLNDFVLEYDIIKNLEYEQQCKCKSE